LWGGEKQLLKNVGGRAVEARSLKSTMRYTEIPLKKAMTLPKMRACGKTRAPKKKKDRDRRNFKRKNF